MIEYLEICRQAPLGPFILRRRTGSRDVATAILPVGFQTPMMIEMYKVPIEGNMRQKLDQRSVGGSAAVVAQ